MTPTLFFHTLGHCRKSLGPPAVQRTFSSPSSKAWRWYCRRFLPSWSRRLIFSLPVWFISLLPLAKTLMVPVAHHGRWDVVCIQDVGEGFRSLDAIEEDEHGRPFCLLEYLFEIRASVLDYVKLPGGYGFFEWVRMLCPCAFLSVTILTSFAYSSSLHLATRGRMKLCMSQRYPSFTALSKP